MINTLIEEMDEKENKNTKQIVKKFESKLCKYFKYYTNSYGFEDFKMNELDYIILYNMWKNVNIIGNLDTYLIIIYSYFKLEDFHFPINIFNCDLEKICKVITKTEVIKLMNNYLYIL